MIYEYNGTFIDSDFGSPNLGVLPGLRIGLRKGDVIKTFVKDYEHQVFTCTAPSDGFYNLYTHEFDPLEKPTKTHALSSHDEKEEYIQEIKFDIVQLGKLNLGPTDVLTVKLIGDDIPDQAADQLHGQLKGFFPSNKVIVFSLPSCNDLQMTVVSSQNQDCSQPNSYCNDCSCGKKERLET